MNNVKFATTANSLLLSEVLRLFVIAYVTSGELPLNK
jgi:hypothetical protein